MSLRSTTFFFGLLFPISVALPAVAQADGLLLWDQSIATAVRESVAINDDCRTSPYALYRQTCVDNELNVSLERSPFDHLTMLDRIALFVDKYKDLDTSRQIMPGIRFKVGVNLSNVYEEEATLHARLRIRW